MSDRPTPETDAARHDLSDYGSPVPCSWGDWVPVDVAERLERERDETREELAILRSNKMSDPLLEATFKHLIRERDEAREEIEALRHEYHGAKAMAGGFKDKIKSLTEQCEEAREAAAKWEAVALREASINGARICAKEEAK